MGHDGAWDDDVEEEEEEDDEDDVDVDVRVDVGAKEVELEVPEVVSIDVVSERVLDDAVVVTDAVVVADADDGVDAERLLDDMEFSLELASDCVSEFDLSSDFDSFSLDGGLEFGLLSGFSGGIFRSLFTAGSIFGS